MISGTEHIDVVLCAAFIHSDTPMDSSDSEYPYRQDAVDVNADFSNVDGTYQSKAEMFIDQHGDQIHPMLAADDRYIQQASIVPTAKTLK